jgi:hypothetical protein
MTSLTLTAEQALGEFRASGEPLAGCFILSALHALALHPRSIVGDACLVDAAPPKLAALPAVKPVKPGSRAIARAA